MYWSEKNHPFKMLAAWILRREIDSLVSSLSRQHHRIAALSRKIDELNHSRSTA